MKKTLRQFGVFSLVLVIMLSAVLTSCGRSNNGDDTDAATNDNRTDDTTENVSLPKDPEGLVNVAFEKMSAATYLESEMRLSMKSVTGGMTTEYSMVYNLTFRCDPSGAFYFKLASTDGQGLEFYSEGQKDYFSKSTFEDYDYETGNSGMKTELVHGASNVDFTPENFMSAMPADGDLPFASFPSFGEVGNTDDLDALKDMFQNATMTDREDGGKLIEITMSYKDLMELIGDPGDMLGEIEGMEELENLDGSMTVSIGISPESYPDSIKICVDMRMEGMQSTITVECSITDFNKESGVPAPDWSADAMALDVTEYSYMDEKYSANFTFNEDGTATLNSLTPTSGELPEIFELPGTVDGKTVTEVLWISLGNLTASGGTVIVPDSVDCSEFYDYFYECAFFTNSERPEDCYANSIYFSGEWEMKNGKPTPTREEIVDPYGPKLSTDESFADKWKYNIADYDESSDWAAAGFDDSAWKTGYLNNNAFFSDWSSDNGKAVFLRSTFTITEEELAGIRSGSDAVSCSVMAEYGRMLIYINGELAFDLDGSDESAFGGAYLYLYPGCDGYVCSGEPGDPVRAGENTIAIVALPAEDGTASIGSYGFALSIEADFDPEYINFDFDFDFDFDE